ncbi:hypothetical protein [Streptomyces mirabilis]
MANACSDDLVTVSPDEDLDRAVELMREHGEESRRHRHRPRQGEAQAQG